MTIEIKKAFIGLLVLFTAGSAFASKDRGGGDLCEDRIQVIRNDIVSWIKGGGAKNLVLPKQLDNDRYTTSMLTQMSLASVSCVGKTDLGYPLLVDGVPKVCRFDRTSKSASVVCDFEKFQSMTPSDQYVLIHHEYAGLAGIENPTGATSEYSTSNQISGFLENQIVKKLVIRPSSSGWTKISDEAIFNIYQTIRYMVGRDHGRYTCIRKPTISTVDGSTVPCNSKFQNCIERNVTAELLKSDFTEIAEAAANAKQYFEKITGSQKIDRFENAGDPNASTKTHLSTTFAGTSDGLHVASMRVVKNQSWTSPRIDLKVSGPYQNSTVDELVCELK